MSYCLDISFFSFSILFDLFITCLLYDDSSIHKQFEKGKSMDFLTITLNGIIGVILSKNNLLFYPSNYFFIILHY